MLPGYRVRILDGNCLAATDHRIEVLRNIGAKALPGKSLVVLDPQLLLASDIFPCEDGHAQERSLFDQVLERVKARELWMADRNMCTMSPVCRVPWDKSTTGDIGAEIFIGNS